MRLSWLNRSSNATQRHSRPTLTLLPPRIVPALRSEIAEWVDRWQYSRFITLATNDISLGTAQLPTSKLPHGVLRDRLREWDGRINHAILGKHWAKRHSDRIWAFYFLEKPSSNPHWHGLIRFFPVDDYPQVEQERAFDANASPIWKNLVPSGTVDIKPITVQRGIIDYVGKMLPYPLSYEHFVTPDELRQG